MGVSVIIPARDARPLLVAAVRSALDQGPAVSEVLVVDDASADGSAAALEGMDPRLRVLSGTGGGPAAARNLGADAATGEFLAFLDADDEWQPGSLAARLELLEADPRVALAFCDAELIDRLDRPLGRLHQGRSAPCGWIYAALLLDNYIPASSVVLRAERWRGLAKHFQQDFQPCEDYRLWLRLAAQGPCALDPRQLVRRRLIRAGFGADRLAAITAQTALLEDSLAADGRPELATWPPLRERLVRLQHVRAQLLIADGRRDEALAAYAAAGAWGRLGSRIGLHAALAAGLFPLARRLVAPRRLGLPPLP